MFGFLRVNKKHLDEPRAQMYRAHFCAGCHAMVEFGGRLSSLLTNYDVTFWLWVATALEEQGGRQVPPERRPCTAVPFRSVWVHPLRPQIRQAMASINLALMASKIEDNRRDGDHRVLTFAFRPLVKPALKAVQALRDLGFPAERIEQLAELQSSVEATQDLNLEDFAGPTRELMGEIFAFLAPLTDQPHYADSLRILGRRLGRLLYLLDALSDIEKDRKKGAFNAFLKAQGYPLSYARVAPIMHSAVADLEESLKALPMGQTAPMAQGMVSHLRGLVSTELKRWKGQKAPSAGWGGLRHLRMAGFFKPVGPTDCDCGGCDGCGDGCSGCDCSGCGSCGDGCGSCGHCGSCGDSCSGCGGGGDSCSKIDCCCDTSSCACDTIDCCCWDRNSQMTCCCCSSDSRRSKSGPQYNVTPEPTPVDTKGNWSDTVEGQKKPRVDPKGHRLDSKGRQVDEEGRLIDDQGRHINQLGQLIDDSGNVIG